MDCHNETGGERRGSPGPPRTVGLRPVTPEVAGSSPVGPAKFGQTLAVLASGVLFLTEVKFFEMDDLKRLLDTMRQENAAAHGEARRHFDVVAEGLRRDVHAVAEGVVANTLRIERLESEMKVEFTEVRSMIRLSYTS